MHLQPDFPAAAASVASAGLAVLRGFLSPDQVTALRNTADALACDARAADEATAGGSDLGPDWAATHRGCILETAAGAGMPGTPYACARTDPGLGRLLAGLGAAILGGGGGGGSPHRRPLPSSSTTIRLLNEQFIIKPPHCPASGFAWHTDGQYAVEVGRRAVEEEERGGVAVAATTSGSLSSLLLYLSVWVPLDAVGPANGTLDVGWEAARVAGLVADEEAGGGQGDPPPGDRDNHHQAYLHQDLLHRRRARRRGRPAVDHSARVGAQLGGPCPAGVDAANCGVCRGGRGVGRRVRRK